MGSPKQVQFCANDRQYSVPPRPVVVICIDGCADEYLSVSMARGKMPRLLKMSRDGYRGMVRGALPSFTNVNNAAIVTGRPPSVTGICGNFFLNPDTGEEVMMNSPGFLRCETILTAAAKAGRKVAFVTAKDKLRTVLGDGLPTLGGMAFSSEKVDEAEVATHGVSAVENIVGKPKPEIYSGDASLYVLDAGAALIEQGRADFLYLSLTDFMQHKFAPEDVESLEFHASIDKLIGRIADANAIIGITADHGMNEKTKPDGTPNVIYVESLLQERFGKDNVRVICPITDPYVVHHGALGSLVMVHLVDPNISRLVRECLIGLDGVTEVYQRADAAKKLQLAPDRIGDLTVMCGRDFVLGRRPEDHDLSVLQGTGLRSHGGRYEEMVPMVLSRPLNTKYTHLAKADPRNFDIFDFTCNGG